MRRVGLDRFLKGQWLDKTLEIVNTESDVPKIREALEQYLKQEIPGDITRRKARDKLMGIWVNIPEELEGIRNEALMLSNNIFGSEQLLFHWTMMSAVYPIFRDIAKIIGTITDFQDGFTMSLMQKRIYEIWGERSTVKYAVQKNMCSMVDWEVIERKGNGRYKRTPSIKIEDVSLKLLFLKAYILTSNKDYIGFIEANNIKTAFPFELQYKMEDFASSDEFVLVKMGNYVAISLA
jgi:hypothetical protein